MVRTAAPNLTPRTVCVVRWVSLYIDDAAKLLYTDDAVLWVLLYIDDDADGEPIIVAVDANYDDTDDG